MSKLGIWNNKTNELRLRGYDREELEAFWDGSDMSGEPRQGDVTAYKLKDGSWGVYRWNSDYQMEEMHAVADSKGKPLAKEEK